MALKGPFHGGHRPVFRHSRLSSLRTKSVKLQQTSIHVFFHLLPTQASTVLIIRHKQAAMHRIMDSIHRLERYRRLNYLIFVII